MDVGWVIETDMVFETHPGIVHIGFYASLWVFDGIGSNLNLLNSNVSLFLENLIY